VPKKHFYRFLPYKSKNNFWKNQSQVIVGYAAVVVVLKANAVGANRRYQPNKKRGRHRHVQSFITQPPCCKVPLLHRIQIL